MDRTTLDAAVAILVAGILVLGAGAAWQTYRQTQAHAEMMGHGGMGHGFHPVWYLLGTVLVASVVAGAYLLVRNQLGADGVGHEGRGAEPPAEPFVLSGEKGSADADPSQEPIDDADQSQPSRPDVLTVLPEDERRVLEPVLESPGLTQIELRDRADFSKSKVSQTVTELEKRGLLYREKQGRTYRVYPSDDLES
ncbi:helix-turn-helix transcriptional regulator [Natronobacterium texcoconense]|uniref:MarR family protein n=1 Tax=Natronobacterium texcoconense TaxID=1095778 RepID=A0A1H1I254_NATTX|nr:MarR family transcriptional regulator [Natronobacterium texcoconense]SDR31750.1 MarR family protein [Natronobacterium texcoconense]